MKNEIIFYKNILERFLTKKFKDFIGMYLYGSKLNNNSNENSDLDVVLLFKKVNHKKRREIYNKVSDIEYENNIFLDIKTLTLSDLANNPNFYNEIKDYGIYYGK